MERVAKMASESEWEIVKQFASDPPVDVKRLASKLGLTYVEKNMPSDESGGISYDGLQYVISINSDETSQRKRFTAAHEIAHYLLHRDILKQTGHMDRLFDSAAYRNPSDPFTPAQEVQANRYAASLLMPKFAIEGEINRGTNSVSKLASKFDVSKIAMRYRLENLGLIGSIADD